MKKTILILIAVFSISILNAQRYINIGSSKRDVKKVMGEPTSIRNHEFSKKEVWGYGEYGLATVTFKNGKLFEYSNMSGILKIGKRNTRNRESKDALPMDKIGEEDKIDILGSFSKEGFEYLDLIKGSTIGGIYHPQLDELLKQGNVSQLDINVDYTGQLAANQSSGEEPNLGVISLIFCLIIGLVVFIKNT